MPVIFQKLAVTSTWKSCVVAVLVTSKPEGALIELVVIMGVMVGIIPVLGCAPKIAH
jgi:hypothetical protein